MCKYNKKHPVSVKKPDVFYQRRVCNLDEMLPTSDY